MNQTARREQFTPRSNQYYQEEFKAFSERGECALLIAERDGKLLASRMVFAFGNHAAEFHAGSVQNLEGLHPNYFLVWEGIQWAKAKGCMTYDMWGSQMISQAILSRMRAPICHAQMDYGAFIVSRAALVTISSLILEGMITSILRFSTKLYRFHFPAVAPWRSSQPG